MKTALRIVSAPFLFLALAFAEWREARRVAKIPPAEREGEDAE